MAVIYRASSGNSIAAANTTTTALSVAMGNSVLAGDWLVAIVSARTSGSAETVSGIKDSLNDPTGSLGLWQNVFAVGGATGADLLSVWYLRNSLAGTPTITGTIGHAATNFTLGVMAFTGAGTIDTPVTNSGSIGSASTSFGIVGSVSTPTYDHSHAIAIAAAINDASGVSWAGTGSYTQRGGVTPASATTAAGLVAWTWAQSTASSVGLTLSASGTNSSQNWRWGVFVLAPAPIAQQTIQTQRAVMRSAVW